MLYAGCVSACLTLIACIGSQGRVLASEVVSITISILFYVLLLSYPLPPVNIRVRGGGTSLCIFSVSSYSMICDDMMLLSLMSSR